MDTAATRRRFMNRSLVAGALGSTALGGLLAACGPEATPGGPSTGGSSGGSGQPSGQAGGQGQAPVAGQPKPGGTLRIALYQEPAILNPYLNSQTAGTEVMNLIFLGLTEVDPDGKRLPVLATEVPTVQNGGVSADGKTVTYKLRRDVKWHDGKPFTAKDVQFTWQAIMDTSNPIASRTGYNLITAVEMKDEYTATVVFKEFYAPFATLFPSILPAHAYDGKTAGMDKHDQARKPIGTGPFKVQEWSSGNHVTLAKHADFHQKGKPYLDQVVFRITPSREVGIAQVKTGEADVVWDLSEASVPEVEADPNLIVWSGPAPDVERLILNFSAPSGPTQGLPGSKHPVLSDPKVREAIELAINKKGIVDKLLFGKTTVASSPVPMGWAAYKPAPVDYNPNRAKQLLDEAGWRPGPDGIRAKDGVKMALTYSTTTGNALRERTQQVIQENLQEVGILLEIRNLPSAVLLGQWADNSPRKRGNFDINMWTTNAGIDPHQHLVQYFHSSQIPTEANKGDGFNYSRLMDPEVDKALEEAGATPDEAKRKAAYERALKGIIASRAHIYLYNRLDVDGARKYVQGHKNNAWSTLTWDLHEWWLNK
jgi:peptide/nickel transport system substrate-binding protein